MSSSNLPLFFQLFSICHLCLFPGCFHLLLRVLSQTYIVQFICFAIVSLASLKLALFNSICFSNCLFFLSQTCIFHLHLFFAFVIFAFLRVAFISPIFLHWFSFFSSQVENILEQAQFRRDKISWEGAAPEGGREAGTWKNPRSQARGAAPKGSPSRNPKRMRGDSGALSRNNVLGKKVPITYCEHRRLSTPKMSGRNPYSWNVSRPLRSTFDLAANLCVWQLAMRLKNYTKHGVYQFSTQNFPGPNLSHTRKFHLDPTC